jgi:hypothetical protein
MRCVAQLPMARCSPLHKHAAFNTITRKRQVEARSKVAAAMLVAASSASCSSLGGQRRTPKAAGKDSGDSHVQSIIALLQVKKV